MIKKVLMRKQTKLINSQIQKIIYKSNLEIQQIKGISKYEEFFGKVSVRSHFDDTNSIKSKFYRNWFSLDDSIPEWSYPLIYDIALKESKLSGTFRQPEDLVASSNAEKTVKQLEKQQ